MARFSLLVFDWDGTLMDSESRIVTCIRAAVTDLGLPEREDEAIRNIIGLGLREAVDTLYPGCDEVVHQGMLTRYRHHYLGPGGIPTQLFPGALETIQQLADAGYLLAVATGKSRVGLDEALRYSGLGGFFHYTRCADETLSKPHPRMLLEVMEFCGVEPDDTLMIGDTEYDLAMARNAGTAALGVSYGVHDEARLLEQEPLGLIHSIRDLPTWLVERS